MEITSTTITEIVDTLAEFTELGRKQTYLTVYNFLPEKTVAPFRRQTIITAVENGNFDGLPRDILEKVSKLLFRKVSTVADLSDDVRMGYLDLLSHSFGKREFEARLDEYPFTWSDLLEVAERNEDFMTYRTTLELCCLPRSGIIDAMKKWSARQHDDYISASEYSESDAG
jgi:hypothetical protein